GSLAPFIRADDVETRQTPGKAGNEIGADALLPPGIDHSLTVEVVAEGGDVVDADAGVAAGTRQIDRGVEGVAAEADLQGLGVSVAQLDHALADGGDALHGEFHFPANRGQPRLLVLRD